MNSLHFPAPCERTWVLKSLWTLIAICAHLTAGSSQQPGQHCGQNQAAFSFREEQRWNPGLPSGPWVLRSDEISSPTWVQPLPGRAVRWRSTCCLLLNAHGACVNLPGGLGTERSESGAPPTFLFSNHESCRDILPQTEAPVTHSWPLTSSSYPTVLIDCLGGIQLRQGAFSGCVVSPAPHVTDLDCQRWQHRSRLVLSEHSFQFCSVLSPLSRFWMTHWASYKSPHLPGMVSHACYPSIWDAEEEQPGVWQQPELQS